MTANIEVRPVGPDEVGAVGRLFASARTTRHCWCMSFCTSRAQFATGWFGEGNQRRFEAMAGAGSPLGVVASLDGLPVGWRRVGTIALRGAGAWQGFRCATGPLPGRVVTRIDVVTS